MEFPIKEVGVIVLAVIVALAIILFILSGIGTQTTTFKDTSDWVLSNLTEQAEQAKSTVIIG